MLGTGLMVQSLRSEDGTQCGVDVEQTHTVGVDGALQRIGELIVLIAIWGQYLQNFSVSGCIFRDCDLIGLLGEDGIIVIVVQNKDVNLEDKKQYDAITHSFT